MSESSWDRRKMGVNIELEGDGQTHTIFVGRNDVAVSYDDISQVLTIHLWEDHDAKELYWDLLEAIPKLRHDRH